MLQQLAQSGGSQMMQGMGMFPPPGINMATLQSQNQNPNSQSSQLSQMGAALQGVSNMGLQNSGMGQNPNSGMMDMMRQQQQFM